MFADPETGALAGLWRGGDHGDDTQDTSRTDECHDITVFPSKNLAAGACSGNGILFDISDPYNPRRLDVVTDVGFAYWHSATLITLEIRLSSPMNGEVVADHVAELGIQWIGVQMLSTILLTIN